MNGTGVAEIPTDVLGDSGGDVANAGEHKNNRRAVRNATEIGRHIADRKNAVAASAKPDSEVARTTGPSSSRS